MSEIIITSVSKNEINQLVEKAVEKENRDKMNNNSEQTTDFLDVNHAAEFLGIAKATLYGKCSNLLIPHFK